MTYFHYLFSTLINLEIICSIEITDFLAGNPEKNIDTSSCVKRLKTAKTTKYIIALRIKSQMNNSMLGCGRISKREMRMQKLTSVLIIAIWSNLYLYIRIYWMASTANPNAQAMVVEVAAPMIP